MERRFQRLEAASNVAILIAAVICVGVWSRAYILRVPAPVDGSAYYSPGEVLPKVGGVDFSRAPMTLLVIVSSTCKFCTDSMPFYRSLTVAKSQQNADAQIVFIGQEHQSRLRDYLQEHQVAPDNIVSVGSQSSMKVRRTPTILQVDRRGQIVRTWNGRLSPAAEQAVLDVLDDDGSKRLNGVL